jgi:hypothetical protein
MRWKARSQTGAANVDLAHLLRADSLLAVNIGSRRWRASGD